MKSWGKPVFSILSVNATKDNSFFRILSGAPYLDGNDMRGKAVDPSKWEGGDDDDSTDCINPSGGH